MFNLARETGRQQGASQDTHSHTSHVLGNPFPSLTGRLTFSTDQFRPHVHPEFDLLTSTASFPFPLSVRPFNYSSCLDGYCSLNIFSIFCPYNPSGCNDVFPVSVAAQNPMYSLRNKTDFPVHKTVPLWQAPFPLRRLSTTTTLNSPFSIIVVHSWRRDC